MNLPGSPNQTTAAVSSKPWLPLTLTSFSIRYRLPLLIGLLLVVTFVASGIAAYRAVRESALEVARERLVTLVNYLGPQLQQQSALMSTRTATSANEAAVRAFLRSPSPATREEALASLKQLAMAQDLNNLQVELWNHDSTLVLTVPQGATPASNNLETEFNQSSIEPFKTVGAIRIVNGIAAYPVIGAAKDESGKPLGYVVRWRKLAASPETRKQLTDIVGNQAVLYIGNASGEVWTDLLHEATKPPVSTDGLTSVSDYIRDGQPVMGTGRPISGTPWFMVIEFPTRPLLAQPNAFLRRMIFASLAVLALGIAASILLSRNITKPLQSLTHAASAISAGDYSQSVDMDRADELGTLGKVFNTMVVKVRDSHRELEQKVRDRTAQLEAAAGALLMVDATGLISSANQKAETLFGYDRGELLGQPVEMLIPERYRSLHPGHRRNFFHSPSTRAMGEGRDLFGRRKDGTEIPIEISLNPIQTGEGAFVLANIVDITERKRAAQETRRSQQQLAGIISSAMDAVITVDESQRIVLFNGAAERMFLFPAEDAIGQPLDRFIPERFREAHKEHIKKFGQTHVTRRSMGALGALYGLRRDGEKFPIEASISQIESDGKRLYTVILRDVTERRRAEESIREQARILDLAPVMIRDLSGRILFWNTGVEKMYGWKAEEALEKFSHKLLKTEFPRPLEEIKTRLLADGHWEGEVVHTGKDGRRIEVASHWVLHRDEHDKPKAVLVVNNDITERRQAEREIRRLNEELEQRVAERTAQLKAANKELEAFSYSVSHDLRAPLRHINGFSQALLEDYQDRLDDEGREYLQEVRSASQEMAKLIDDLLQLARITRGEMRREEVNLSELASSVIGELQKRNGKRNVTIEIGKGLNTLGDKRLLRVVLTNLLGNAWKFTSHRKQAEVSFGQADENGESIYFVRDNGAGFDMAYANKLFGAFQRLHTAGEFEGTGIGLATVQRIISRHGGHVWAEGVVDEGATFYFTLPNVKETGDESQSDSAG